MLALALLASGLPSCSELDDPTFDAPISESDAVALLRRMLTNTRCADMCSCHIGILCFLCACVDVFVFVCKLLGFCVF